LPPPWGFGGGGAGSAHQCREETMQLVLGIIIGILVTIGTAYVLDSGRAPVCPAGADCPMVNWDVANERVHNAKVDIEATWHRMTGRS
jgi:hypothetical protein